MWTEHVWFPHELVAKVQEAGGKRFESCIVTFYHPDDTLGMRSLGRCNCHNCIKNTISLLEGMISQLEEKLTLQPPRAN